jgi:PIN domain nuclease of toxin-antitoxin system
VRLLLDTHVVLWQLQGSLLLSPAGRAAIEQASDLMFSVVSFAEIGVKAALGKLSVARDLRERVVQSGLQILRLDADHGLAVADLPMHHRDPFDRLLIAQARSENLTILTADRRIAAYEVPVIDAGRAAR